MKPLHEILAKSANYGSLTLLEHTQQVTIAIELFAQKYAHNFDVAIARKGAILHDLGKAHPLFQRKIQNINAATLHEKRQQSYRHRHEISSLAFLPCFPKHEWDLLIDLVVAHHKSIKNDPSGGGIIDLVERDRHFIDNHLDAWDEWHLYGLEILKHFDLPICPISKDVAKNALLYVVGYCEAKKKGVSLSRGLLKSADHFASAFMANTPNKLRPLFEIPDLRFYHDEARKSHIYPLSRIPTNDGRKHTLIVAPTGAGKTDFLLRRCKGRVFYTLPYQASINAMWERLKKTVPNGDIRLLHATSKIVAKKDIDEQILQPFPGSSIKVLTPHQIAAIIFGTSGFEAVMLDLEGTDVILDEIHTYSDFSRSMVIEIVKTLLRLNCIIHIGTATMPSVLYNELLCILGGDEKVYQVKLSDDILDSFDRHQIDKIEDDFQTINTILRNAIEKKEKVLLVYNTIGRAQAAYERLLEEFPEIPKMIIHSRFKRGDRVSLEGRLKKEFNGEDGNEGLSPCIVVSTQVVEVSLDISFDRMITQCAPLDGMIQRFGRVNRKRNKETIGKYKPIHVVKPNGNVLPYKLDILKASYDQLPQNFEVLNERTLQDKIDCIYQELDTKAIDVHLIYKADNVYTIDELTDNKRAVLVEALEIDSAACILESDRDAYLNGDWEERLQLEIPINYKTISRHKNKYEQLEIGVYPYVVPQDRTLYELYGLQFVEPDNFL